MLLDLIAIGVGGALGSMARYLITMAAIATLGAAAVGTLIVNVVGCFFIGMLAESIVLGTSMPERLQLASRVGVLGGLTTFSSFGLDAILLASRSSLMLTGGYIVANVLLGIGSVWAGAALVRGWMG